MSAILAWINRLDAAELTAENANPARPISNLQRRGLAEFAEPVDDLSMLYVYPVEWADDIDFVAFLGVVAGTYEVQYLDSTVITPTWVSAASVVVSHSEPRYGLPAHAFIVDAALPRGAQVRLACSGRIARLWAGPSLRLPKGVGAQWRLGFKDYGRLEAGEGLTHVQTLGARARVLSIPLGGAIDTATAWGITEAVPSATTHPMNLHALQMEAGTTGEVIAIPLTRSPIWMARTGIYGHITSEWEIEHEAGPYSRGALVVEEER